MIKILFGLAGLGALALIGNTLSGGRLLGTAWAGNSEMWSGPPPWTSTADDSVEPRIFWSGRMSESDLPDMSCSVPSPGSNEDVVAVGLYESATLSSAAIGGLDQETNFITVRIEPGDKPLYLVLTSYESMVWRLTGATKRVARVVVSTYHRQPGTGAPASGVIGIAEPKVSFPRPGCLGNFNNASESPRALERLYGSWLDRIRLVTAYSALDVSLPSGAITPDPKGTPALPPGFDRSAWSEAARYWPGGIAMVPPKLIVSPATARSYQVLPSQAGIAQLLGSGAMVNSGGGLRIVKAIPHLPSGMGGAHRADISLASGLPIPDGDLVHACLKIEDNGEQRGVCDFGR
jgi:hypothetical protein